MASGPAVFPSTRESTNYARLCRLLVDVGSQALRDTFDRIHSPATLHRILSSTSAYYPTLQSLRKRRILNPIQWGKLYPSVCSSVSSASFDITLLVVLLRNICGFSPPASTGNWDMLPLPGDNSCEANIARIKYYRNEVYAHANQASVDDATFNMLWQDISNALIAVGSGTTYASAISRLKTECMDPDFEEHYRELLKQWKKDDDNTKEELDELKEMVKSEVKEVKEMVKSEVREVKEMLTQWKRKEGDAKDNMGGIEGTSNENLEQANAQKTKEGQREGESQLQEFIQRLKDIVISSTGHVTDLQQPFRPNPGEGPPAKDFTVDEIFVNVVIREGRVSYNFPADRWEQLKVYPMASAEQTNPLRPQDIFDSGHRNVLAVGRPGIGKTLLCTRLLRFWASDDTKIQSQCEVAFLLKFRHLNSQPDLNLRELLTRAETVECLEDGLWQYIKDNPSKVLLIFDGLDEFSSTPGIARDDSRFNNTAEVRMPMGCLYKKIASGKLFQGCTLLTTVRPTAVEDVRELQFDRTVEITGFTFEQVEEFVEKFTKDDDSGKLKEIIWQHISTNINLFSLCYIPVNCFIICHCLLQLINISSDAEHKLPVKITEIYSISVKIFFYKHSRGKYSCSKTDLGCYMYKRFDDLQPENDEVFKKLGKIAFNGIKGGELVFESLEVSGLEDCGLLHRLPDIKPRKLTQPSRAQYCFTHLTVQEFFAAKHLTDTLPKDKLQRFVADHIRVGTWKVVMQFVAGLLEPDTRQRTTKSEIFTHLLPEKIGRSDQSDLIWWPCSEEDKRLALDVCKCLYEFDGEQEKVKIQSKGAQIGFNAVDFSQMGVVPIDCPAVMGFVRDANVISLKIDSNSAGQLGCKEIQYSLKDVNCKLTQLKLRVNNIGDQGAAHLSDALKDVNCKLTQLDLGGNKIGDQGAAHLGDALKDVNCKLTELNLWDNKIGDQGAAHLSDALKDVNCKLTQLDLETNKIGYQGAAHLSDALKDVNCKLTQLNLCNNKIGDQGAAHLSDALKDVNCKFTQLDLRRNKIGDQGAAHLSDALKDVNCKLTKLNLCNNKIGDQGAAHLSDALKDVNCKLTQLDLAINEIGDQGAAHLSDALKDVNCKLTRLNLWGNEIGDQGAAHLSDALKDVNCKLTLLNLRGNKIGGQGAAHLSDAFKDVNCKLTLLNLRGNKIGGQGAAHLSDALKDVNCKLTQLDLLGNKIGDQGAAHLSDALKDVNCKLTQLVLASNEIGDQGAAHLSDALKDVNCKLTGLTLGGNKIGDQGAAHLSDALKDVNCNLTQLDLGGNNLGDQEAAHLSDALKDVNCKLTQLDLAINEIGDQGAAHLSDALKDVNCKLTQLDLAINEIGDQGAAHLSDALKDVICKLTQLNLRGNKIGDQGAAHLIDALKDVNCKLTQLFLASNEIDQGTADLSDAIKYANCKVTQLNLWDNEIGYQGASHLSDALKDVSR
ncbi:NLR family CARD domain-containing protein 3-like isoform X2 [Montipora foliosa]|uniref:NLR family CARD domain-containing protein 3-like isoform X2 n=2 Tax=Montipora foliosa TaxID=591990 RepID=UPI0035F11855